MYNFLKIFINFISLYIQYMTSIFPFTTQQLHLILETSIASFLFFLETSSARAGFFTSSAIGTCRTSRRRASAPRPSPPTCTPRTCRVLPLPARILAAVGTSRRWRGQAAWDERRARTGTETKRDGGRCCRRGKRFGRCLCCSIFRAQGIENESRIGLRLEAVSVRNSVNLPLEIASHISEATCLKLQTFLQRETLIQTDA
jgi:hypothetical protein